MYALFALVVALSAAPGPGDPLPLTLGEAVELGLLRDRALRAARLGVDAAKAQVDEVWGRVYPSVDLSLGYTRHFETANPFAGSDAGSLFDAFGPIQWLAYNELARTDADAGTAPITLQDFLERQAAGRDAAGGDGGTSSNPFFVPNVFSASVSVTQVLYNGGVFEALKVVDALEAQSRAAVRVRAHAVVAEVSGVYYGALLATARVEVLIHSVERARQTVAEVTGRVEQGVAPRFQQLSAEVELSNLETTLLQARNGAARVEDALRIALALPADRPLALRDTLDVLPEAQPSVDLDAATDAALAERPDLQQLRESIRLLEVDRESTRARFLPVVNAFLRGGYTGNVPDDRTSLVSAPDDPFAFRQHEESFFSDAYWLPNLSAGLILTWNLFDGFATGANVRRTSATVAQAQVRLEEAADRVRVQVRSAHRDLEAARKQLASQRRNIERAELNYEHARVRVQEGVSTPLELREASNQLDQTRFNQLQAVHDLRVARVSFQVAVGRPPGADPASGRPE